MPWIKRNPPKKSSVVLYGESVAITPINKAIGLVSRFIPKQIIINDRFLALIFDEPDKKNKNIAVPNIRNSVT